MSATVALNSLSAMASMRTVAVCAEFNRPRSLSSTRALARTTLRSGNSATTAPGQARSPSLKSGVEPPVVQLRARKLGMMVTMPSAGARNVREAICRSATFTSKSALSFFSFFDSISASPELLVDLSFCCSSLNLCSASGELEPRLSAVNL